MIALSAWMLAQAIQPTADASQLLTAARAGTAVPVVAGPDAVRWGLFVVGLSFTFVNIPVQTLALEALTGDALAKASSLFLSTKLIFSSIGVAILTTLLVDSTRTRATDLVSQLQALTHGAAANASDPGALAALRAIEAQIAVQAGTGAIQHIFWLIFFGSFALIVLSLALPGRKRQIAAAQVEETPAVTTPVQA